MAKIAVTGAYGYSGRHIAKRLINMGHTALALTNSKAKPEIFGQPLETRPFNFDSPFRLADSLNGVDCLINTYWIRYNSNKFTHGEAVENSLKLFAAAKLAGVKKIVHTSITNADENSHLEYFSGKGLLERNIKESGLSYSILRPAVFFGHGDILINNIAWYLRRFPVFGVFGDGEYKIEPVHVEDFAELAANECFEKEDKIINAAGPESFTYKGLVEAIAKSLGLRRDIINIKPWIGHALGYLSGKALGDITITKEEIDGLMSGLLYTGSEPSGRIKLTAWAAENKDTLGKVYSNEMKRRK